MGGTETHGLPVLLDVAGRSAVIVGGDDEAAALASILAERGARVTVVAGTPSDAVRALAASATVTHLSRDYVRGDLAEAFLAVCLETGETSAAVAAEAATERCLAFVADRPDLSAFRPIDRAELSASTEESA